MAFRIFRKRFPANPPHFPANAHSLYFTCIQKLVHQIFTYAKCFHRFFCAHKICVSFKHFYHLLAFYRYRFSCPLIRCFGNYNHILFLRKRTETLKSAACWFFFHLSFRRKDFSLKRNRTQKKGGEKPYETGFTKSTYSC